MLRPAPLEYQQIASDAKGGNVRLNDGRYYLIRHYAPSILSIGSTHALYTCPGPCPSIE